jgi:hypothetical protein
MPETIGVYSAEFLDSSAINLTPASFWDRLICTVNILTLLSNTKRGKK